MEQTKTHWLSVQTAAERPASLWGTLQANYLRTRPVSSNEASPLCSSAPRSVGRGQCTGPTPVPAQSSARSSPPEVVWAAHTSALGRGTVMMTSWAQESKQNSASSKAPLGRSGRRRQGIGLSYVTSFLGVRGPGMSQSSAVGGGWGRGRRLSSPLLLLLLQTSADLCSRHCFPSAPASSRHLPLGVENQEGLLLSECVKQQLAGFPGRKPGFGLRTRHLGMGAKGERPGTMPPPCPRLPIPQVLPTSS